MPMLEIEESEEKTDANTDVSVIFPDSTTEELKTYHYKDGYVYFETDHFSYYAVLEEGEPDTDAVTPTEESPPPQAILRQNKGILRQNHPFLQIPFRHCINLIPKRISRKN